MPFQIIFMDAGQGDATLIVYPDKTLTLVDCGSKKNKNIVSTEIAEVLDRFMTSTGKRLKALVLTHPDGDHYNLVKPLIIDKGVTVDTVYYGGIASDYTGISSWLTSHTNAVSFSQGHSSIDVVPGLSFDGGDRTPNVEVRILAANAGNPKVKADANPNSIVLSVTYFDLNIFLMGDSTTLTEIFLIFRLGTDLDKLLKNRRNVLKVGHHGSNTSTSESWLRLIKPQVCFVSSDTRTFSGVSIPRSTVLDRIFALDTLHNFGDKYEHKYVEYNDSIDRHQQVSTTKAMYSTLHLLKFAPNNLEFVAYGTSWYYLVDNEGNPSIGPACDWENINKAY